MKLIIQIPCMNEAETLPLVFENMPTRIEGIDVIEYQIIDDGSTDNTVEIAKKLGVHHIISSSPIGKNRRWLGRAFKKGIQNALKEGADILVNTDGDNQYPSERIPDLVRPIVEKKAEIVVGDRQTTKIDEFSPIKKLLQKIGSKVTSISAGENIPDAVSGFRAYSSKALQQINIITNYTYTVDTLIQATKKGLDIEWIPISVNKKTRESRLIKSLWSKVLKSGSTILRMYAIYEPFKIFFWAGVSVFLPGILLVGRFLFYYVTSSPRAGGLIQSLLIGSVLILVSVQLFSLGIIADLIRVNRKLIEKILEIEKRKI